MPADIVTDALLTQMLSGTILPSQTIWLHANVVKCLCADAEIIKDHNALTYTLKPEDLQEAAESACKLRASDINTIFPDVSPVSVTLRLL